MQSCGELNEFMPILTATNGLAYCVLKGQLSCHKGAAVCQDTRVLGGQGLTEGQLGRATGGLAGQGYRGPVGEGYRGQLGRATGAGGWGYRGPAAQGYRGASWAGLQGAAGQGYRGTAGQGYRGAAGQGYRGGQLGRATGEGSWAGLQGDL